MDELINEFVYIFLLYTAFSLLLQASLSLSPRFIASRVNFYLPFFVGISLWASVLGVDLLLKGFGLGFSGKTPLPDYLVIAGLFLGDFIYCALAHACDFSRCKMPAFKLEEAVKPCEGHALLMAISLWVASAGLWVASAGTLAMVVRLSWSNFLIFTLIAWGVAFLQLLWGMLVSTLSHRA